MKFVAVTGKPKQRRDPLAGDGPIVNRARAALKHTAAQFGKVIDADQTSVTVRTVDGISLTLRYDGGNYIFSRVYNLKVTVRLPDSSTVPAGLELSHRDKFGPKFVRRTDRAGSSPNLDAMNAIVTPHLRNIDLVSAETSVTGSRSDRVLSLVPMGGAFVWVLIPPVFKATAFPSGEIERILCLIRTLSCWAPVAH